jgi:hypothetical protein
MADGITRVYRLEQLIKQHREWHTKNPRERTPITDYSSRVICRGLLGVGRLESITPHEYVDRELFPANAHDRSLPHLLEEYDPL